MDTIKVCAKTLVVNNQVQANACIEGNISHCTHIASYAGTANYVLLKNKPQINSVELVGDKSQAEILHLGNGLDFDANDAIEIQNEVIFDCGTSTITI